MDEEEENSWVFNSTANSIDETPQFLNISQSADTIQEGVHWVPSYYPAWTNSTITIDYIASVVSKVQRVLGFQFDASRNVFELLMSQLDSRASRSTPDLALQSLHADYIGATHSNYYKWYFSAQMDDENWSELGEQRTLKEQQQQWQQTMQQLPKPAMIDDLVVYLSCWCEANQVRYMPECLAFIFKCARDFYARVDREGIDHNCPKNYFLNSVITPLYKCYADCNFETIDGKLVRREGDHRNLIGYDDINQLFWYIDGIKRLKTNKEMLINLHSEDRYLELGSVQWRDSVRKTYYETRSSLHIITNFSRVLILHASAFWFYMAFNTPTLYTENYNYRTDASPMTHIKLTTVALGGAIGPLLTILALLGELWFVPRSFAGAQPVIPRLAVSSLVLGIVLGPSIYIYLMTSWTSPDLPATVVASIQFAISILVTIYLSVQPLHSLIGAPCSEDDRRFLANRYFTNSFQRLSGYEVYLSWCMSALIFTAKLSESYFFLTLSVKDPIYELSIMNLTETCLGDVYMGSFLCRAFPKLLLVAVVLLEMVLFFLDTYLWYVIVNSTISVVISFYLGASIWTPWRNIYLGLPKRISSKLLTDKKSMAIKIVWNAIIHNMVHNYLLSHDKAKELVYTIKFDSQIKSNTVVEPIFFTAEEDGSQILPNKDAQRRVSFFAQSLSQPIPEPMRTDQMPSFTVLIPHYAEKIALSLKETIKHNNSHGKVTILEYLQKLHPSEWQHFVEHSKRSTVPNNLPGQDILSQENNMLVNMLGFSTSKPQDTNKTRLWCSARSQTLYRTVSGFMNYASAIKLLHYSENDQVDTPDLKTIDEVDELVSRKFRLIVAMQKYSSFNETQLEDTELLLELFPEIKVVYVDVETTDSGDELYYSSLIDSTCELLQGRRIPKYRIQISGNPILGDGKSDNQNHSLIFYRGEYIQLIDSNQDNYLEECLKIRNVLAEFEEIHISPDPYSQGNKGKVAIVGAREYIFSENIGVLGDVAAGKEQTFGTLFARSLAKVGGKLHYGHPDFLNAVFMTTRGGVSKAQKGLHLNEDIYAGMMVLSRGGRIKHTEYIQCGKGRDLGFISILNFTTKVGAGMGEQILSREYFWLGTKLPFDRFMSFYYGHPGFHLNNVAILMSISLFLIILTWIAVINHTTRPCDLVDGQLRTQARLPPGCTIILPFKEWVTRCVSSISIVFLVAQLPLFIQELSEKGLSKSLARICKHFVSLSMFFEIFVCQIYASAFKEDLSIGGAKYISTGRGFATTRTPLHVLYEGFSSQSLYTGACFFLSLTYTSIVFWQPSLLWFWLTALALTLSPTLFNPHQFQPVEFFLDYRATLKWLVNGGWIAFTRQKRAKVTGYHQRKQGDPLRPSIWNLLVSEVTIPALGTVCSCIPYIYFCSQRLARFQRTPTRNPLLQIIVLGSSSYGANIAAVILSQFGTMAIFFCKRRQTAAKVLATITYLFAFLLHIGIYYVLFMLNRRNFADTILALFAITSFERFLVNASLIFLGRQLTDKDSNEAWWTGHWGVMRRGWRYWLVPASEMVCKVAECSLFSLDFMLIHFITACNLPMVCIPRFDDVHSMFLLWLAPSQPLPVPLRLAKQQKQVAVKFAVLCIMVLVALGTTLALPVFFPAWVVRHVRSVKLFGS